MNREIIRKKTCLIYGRQYLGYKFAENHPMDPFRLELATELMRLLGLVESEREIVEPRPASDDEIALVHRHDYIQAVKTALPGCPSAALSLDYGLGTEDNPIFANMHEAAALIAGGTLQAAELVMSGAVDHAFNIGGGLHHAMESTASGFCIYNDAAIAIAAMKASFRVRVMYVDLDAHHADGVQSAFYSDPDVLTLSFHESGRYLFPGTGGVEEIGWGKGRGYSVNVPFEPFTEDESWLEAVEDLVPRLAKRFQPDVIVSQHGCDTHFLDPMAHLSLTTRAMERAARVMHDAAHSFAGGRWVVLAGGGYNVWNVVPRALAAIWAVVSDRPVPAEMPRAWQQRWQGVGHEAPAAMFHDCPDDLRPIPRRLEINQRNRRTLSQVRCEIAPLISHQSTASIL